jgi:hypothetical protein
LRRVPDRQGLGDHAAHRPAQDIGPAQAESADQSTGLVGHGVDGERRRQRLGTAHSGVVEDHDPVVPGQGVDEPRVPVLHGPGVAHDQDQGRAAPDDPVPDRAQLGVSHLHRSQDDRGTGGCGGLSRRGPAGGQGKRHHHRDRGQGDPPSARPGVGRLPGWPLSGDREHHAGEDDEYHAAHDDEPASRRARCAGSGGRGRRYRGGWLLSGHGRSFLSGPGPAPRSWRLHARAGGSHHASPRRADGVLAISRQVPSPPSSEWRPGAWRSIAVRPVTVGGLGNRMPIIRPVRRPACERSSRDPAELSAASGCRGGRASRLSGTSPILARPSAFRQIPSVGVLFARDPPRPPGAASATCRSSAPPLLRAPRRR